MSDVVAGASIARGPQLVRDKLAEFKKSHESIDAAFEVVQVDGSRCDFGR